MNSQLLYGKLNKDFEVRKVGSENVAKGTLYVPRSLSRAKKEEAKQKGYQTADYPQIEIWGSDAKMKYLTENVKKDDMILVEGLFKTGSYENKDKKKVYTAVVYVNDFEFEYKEKENFDDVEI